MLSKKNKMRIVNRTYRHLIELWNLENTETNEILEKVQVPKKEFSIWAEVIPVRGKEYISANKIVAEMQYKIITRYRKDIKQSMLIKWQGKELNIKALIDISGKQEHMEILCIEKVDNDG